MIVKNHLGDRRAGLRFQINGQLWASIDVRRDVVLRNISTSGALLEASLSAELRSARAARLTLPGGTELTVQIRHMTPTAEASTDDLYLVGVEFIGLTSTDRQAVDACVRAALQDVRKRV